jgi:hypothetical protein
VRFSSTPIAARDGVLPKLRLFSRKWTRKRRFRPRFKKWGLFSLSPASNSVFGGRFDLLFTRKQFFLGHFLRTSETPFPTENPSKNSIFVSCESVQKGPKTLFLQEAPGFSPIFGPSERLQKRLRLRFFGKL